MHLVTLLWSEHDCSLKEIVHSLILCEDQRVPAEAYRDSLSACPRVFRFSILLISPFTLL